MIIIIIIIFFCSFLFFSFVQVISTPLKTQNALLRRTMHNAVPPFREDSQQSHPQKILLLFVCAAARQRIFALPACTVGRPRARPTLLLHGHAAPPPRRRRHAGPRPPAQLQRNIPVTVCWPRGCWQSGRGAALAGCRHGRRVPACRCAPLHRTPAPHDAARCRGRPRGAVHAGGAAACTPSFAPGIHGVAGRPERMAAARLHAAAPP